MPIGSEFERRRATALPNDPLEDVLRLAKTVRSSQPEPADRNSRRSCDAEKTEDADPCHQVAVPADGMNDGEKQRCDGERHMEAAPLDVGKANSPTDMRRHQK